VTAGLSLAERKTLRQKYRAEAIARAEQMGRTLRCRDLADDMDDPGHRLCRGESRGGSGCLCRCHDNPGAEIIAGGQS
jgi:hypothetical protein